MDPTEQEREGLNVIADWVGLVGVGGDPSNPRGSLLAHLGMGATMHPRILALIGPSNLQASLAEWRLAGAADNEGNVPMLAPSPVQLSQAGFMGKVAQVVCNVLQPAQAKQPQQNEQTAPPQPQAPQTRKVKVSHVIG